MIVTPTSGPSPHPRGTPGDDGGRDGLLRSIPAPAGNTVQPVVLPGVEVRSIPAPAGNTATHRPQAARASVHPRTRGEHLGVDHPPAARRRSIPAPAGNTSRITRSPGRAPVHPRTRGEHPAAKPHRPGRLRSIPAPAGNTSARRRYSSRSSVHPRTRGEHDVVRPEVGGVHRSIPAPAGNTRGARRLALRVLRSIPAPAGNTALSDCVLRPCTGPSPHPRGTHSSRTVEGINPRSIPAPAGNTSSSAPPAGCPSVHPRTRGEHMVARGRYAAAIGPSPHPRGTRCRSRPLRRCGRSIPAPAGNTERRPTLSRSSPVHPRTRGVHVVQVGLQAVVHRSIPAPAGNTSSSSPETLSHRGPSPHPRGTRREAHPAPGCPPVHPRTRGEHASFTAGETSASGPSPHPRGTQIEPLLGLLPVRSIPAPAGNTS